MTLSDCTKEDLKWIIKRLLQSLCPTQQDYHLNGALNDLWYEKEQRRFEEAEKCSKQADEKRKEFASLLAPYDGKPLGDIPLSVLQKADAIRAEVLAADKKFAKLMGIDLWKSHP